MKILPESWLHLFTPALPSLPTRFWRQGSYPKDFEGELVKKVLAAVEK